MQKQQEMSRGFAIKVQELCVFSTTDNLIHQNSTKFTKRRFQEASAKYLMRLNGRFRNCLIASLPVIQHLDLREE